MIFSSLDKEKWYAETPAIVWNPPVDDPEYRDGYKAGYAQALEDAKHVVSHKFWATLESLKS